MDREIINQELKKYDQTTKKLLKEIPENGKSFIKALRLIGREMLKANFISLMGWYKFCQEIGEEGRKKLLEFTYEMLPWLEE